MSRLFISKQTSESDAELSNLGNTISAAALVKKGDADEPRFLI